MRVVVGLVGVIAAVVMIGAPAAGAAVPAADLALERVATSVRLTTVNPESGLFKGDTGIGYVTVRFKYHNYGPHETADTAVIKDITAPPGTVFRKLDEKYFAAYPGLCKIVVPHTHVRCRINGSIWLDTYNGGSGGHEQTLYFVLKKKCVSPGRIRFDYAGDPKKSNNSISLPVKVPGVSAADCTKPKPSPTVVVAASPTPSAAASPTPSAPLSVGADLTAGPTATSPAAELAALDLPPQGLSRTWGLAVGGTAAVIVAAIGGVTLRLIRSRRRSPDQPPTTA